MNKPIIPGGYILIPRLTEKHPIDDMPPLYRDVWLYILKKARHEKDEIRGFERGECLISIPELQKELTYYVGYRKVTPTKHQIDNILRWLRKTYERIDEYGTHAPMITTTKTTRGMVVKVSGYAFYQNPKNYEYDSENNSKRNTNTTTNTTSAGYYTQELKELKELKDNSAINSALESEFNDWWDLYDKKKDKKTAFNKFKLVRKKYDFDVIMNGTKDYLKTITDKQYQKYPKTFLHNESFLNDFSEDIKTTDKVEDYYNDLLGE